MPFWSDSIFRVKVRAWVVIEVSAPRGHAHGIRVRVQDILRVKS